MAGRLPRGAAPTAASMMADAEVEMAERPLSDRRNDTLHHGGVHRPGRAAPTPAAAVFPAEPPRRAAAAPHTDGDPLSLTPPSIFPVARDVASWTPERTPEHGPHFDRSGGSATYFPALDLPPALPLFQQQPGVMTSDPPVAASAIHQQGTWTTDQSVVTRALPNAGIQALPPPPSATAGGGPTPHSSSTWAPGGAATPLGRGGAGSVPTVPRPGARLDSTSTRSGAVTASSSLVTPRMTTPQSSERPSDLQSPAHRALHRRSPGPGTGIAAAGDPTNGGFVRSPQPSVRGRWQNSQRSDPARTPRRREPLVGFANSSFAAMSDGAPVLTPDSSKDPLSPRSRHDSSSNNTSLYARRLSHSQGGAGGSSTSGASGASGGAYNHQDHRLSSLTLPPAELLVGRGDSGTFEQSHVEPPPSLRSRDQHRATAAAMAGGLVSPPPGSSRRDEASATAPAPASTADSLMRNGGAATATGREQQRDNSNGDSRHRGGSGVMITSPRSYDKAQRRRFERVARLRQPFIDALSTYTGHYDEVLYYAAKQYVDHHRLYHKQLERKAPLPPMSRRFKILSWWERPFSSVSGKVFLLLQFFFLALTVAQLLLESMPLYAEEVFSKYRAVWLSVELPSAAFFAFDLICHLVVLPSTPTEHSRQTRKDLVKSLGFWLDLLTILPSPLQLLSYAYSEIPDLPFLRALRVLRFAKVLRQFPSVDRLAHALEQSWEPLLGPVWFAIASLLVLSGGLYYVEQGTYDPVTKQYLIDDCDCLASSARALNSEFPCPQKVSRFISVPSALWFCFVTMTTVGYGDIVPVCWAGRSLAALTMVLGNVVTAMPIAIVGAYFTDVVLTARRRDTTDVGTLFGEGIVDDDDEALLFGSDGDASDGASGSDAETKNANSESSKPKDGRMGRRRSSGNDSNNSAARRRRKTSFAADSESETAATSDFGPDGRTRPGTRARATSMKTTLSDPSEDEVEMDVISPAPTRRRRPANANEDDDDDDAGGKSPSGDGAGAMLKRRVSMALNTLATPLMMLADTAASGKDADRSGASKSKGKRKKDEPPAPYEQPTSVGDRVAALLVKHNVEQRKNRVKKEQQFLRARAAAVGAGVGTISLSATSVGGVPGQSSTAAGIASELTSSSGWLGSSGMSSITDSIAPVGDGSEAADLAPTAVPLFDPPGALLHVVNDAIRSEFKALLLALSKPKGVEAARVRRRRLEHGVGLQAAMTELGLSEFGRPGSAHRSTDKKGGANRAGKKKVSRRDAAILEKRDMFFGLRLSSAPGWSGVLSPGSSPVTSPHPPPPPNARSNGGGDGVSRGGYVPLPPALDALLNQTFDAAGADGSGASSGKNAPSAARTAAPRVTSLHEPVTVVVGSEPGCVRPHRSKLNAALPSRLFTLTAIDDETVLRSLFPADVWVNDEHVPHDGPGVRVHVGDTVAVVAPGGWTALQFSVRTLGGGSGASAAAAAVLRDGKTLPLLKAPIFEATTSASSSDTNSDVLELTSRARRSARARAIRDGGSNFAAMGSDDGIDDALSSASDATLMDVLEAMQNGDNSTGHTPGRDGSVGRPFPAQLIQRPFTFAERNDTRDLDPSTDGRYGAAGRSSQPTLAMLKELDTVEEREQQARIVEQLEAADRRRVVPKSGHGHEHAAPSLSAPTSLRHETLQARKEAARAARLAQHQHQGREDPGQHNRTSNVPSAPWDGADDFTDLPSRGTHGGAGDEGPSEKKTAPYGSRAKAKAKAPAVLRVHCDNVRGPDLTPVTVTPQEQVIHPHTDRRHNAEETSRPPALTLQQELHDLL